jgi:hypothetical protein
MKKYETMEFNEKIKILNEIKNKPNESRLILNTMTQDERAEFAKMKMNQNILIEQSENISDYGVDLQDESLEDYVKRNNLIPYEVVKNNIEKILGK